MRVWLVLVLLTASFAGNTQGDTTKPDRSFFFFPAFGYSPETTTYLGGVGFLVYDSNLESARSSNAKLELNYSFRKQLIIEASWNHFGNNEKWFSAGAIRYSRYPDFYYGYGSTSSRLSEVAFQSNRITVEANMLRALPGRSEYYGPMIRILSYTNVTDLSGTNEFPELKSATAAGAGAVFVSDHRNNILNATKGHYFNISGSLNRYDGAWYGKSLIDLRAYRTYYKLFTLAVRTIVELNDGNPPFYDVALLGGDARVRGYFYGRFRDLNFAAVQGEVRSKTYWRLGAAVFGGYSNVAGMLTFSRPKPNIGCGIRFLVDKKENVNLRLDYAWGENGETGLYISFGESF